MLARKYAGVLVGLALSGWFGGSARADVLYFSEDNNADGLYTLDVNDASAVQIGMSGVTSSTVGLAPSPSFDLLFGSRWATLLHINADGSGFVDVGGTGTEGLAFDPTGDGTLYGAINGNFFTMDPATGGAIAQLADPGGDIEGLAYGNGFIYGLVALGGGGGDRGDLLRYDIADSSWTNLGNTGLGSIDNAGLAYNTQENVLYAKFNSTLLYRIDPETLEANVIGDTGIASGGGLAFVATSCFQVVNEGTSCHADGSTFTYTVEGMDSCTGGVSTYSFTASGGAVGEEMCFTIIVNSADGGFCCTSEICVTIPDCAPDGGTVVDFEDPIGATPTDLDGFTHEGFDFIHGPDSAGNFQHLHWGVDLNSSWPSNGTNIVIPHGDLIMSASDGSLFDLASVCLAGFVTEDPVHVIGTYPDNSTITVIFELDGVNDGTGSLVDFETLSFPPGFNGLAGARFLLNGTGNGNVAGGFAVDNIVVGTVLVPSDLNGDGVAGIDDLLMLLAAWGSCADCGTCPADFDGDCSVGIFDLLILLENWTA